jgi:hypothetical protein
VEGVSVVEEMADGKRAEERREGVGRRNMKLRERRVQKVLAGGAGWTEAEASAHR